MKLLKPGMRCLAHCPMMTGVCEVVVIERVDGSTPAIPDSWTTKYKGIDINPKDFIRDGGFKEPSWILDREVSYSNGNITSNICRERYLTPIDGYEAEEEDTPHHPNPTHSIV